MRAKPNTANANDNQGPPPSLVPSSDSGFVFSFHIPTCEALFDDYAKRDFLPLLERVATEDNDGITVDVVRAGRNESAWPPGEVQRLEQACRGEWGDCEWGGGSGSGGGGDGGGFGAAAVHVLAGAGHNVHIDDPRGLLELMGPSLDLER